MDGAKIGDSIVVSGKFGGSIMGKHLNFTPRCRLAEQISREFEVHAATDVSDSLALDLMGICKASQCGAVLDLDSIPVSDFAVHLAKQQPDRGTALERALYDGEDFELILCCSGTTAQELISHVQYRKELTVIGKTVNDRGLWTRTKTGELLSLPVKGYEH
jgi:thiamine-monophosphate kinase